jgi:site-specific DNA-methyltransferase (adenine-specific)
LIRIVLCDAIELSSYVGRESVELAYLDPPFSIGAELTARTRLGEARGRRGIAAGPFAYDDRWPSLDAYLSWLAPRLHVVHGLLAPQGTLWLHLDQRAVHEAKVVCDDVFGRARFLGEVIWLPGNGAKSRRGPGIGHQTLLLYAKTRDFVWNARDPALRAPFAQTSLAMHFKNKDERGRVYRDRTVGGKTYRYYADEGRALGSVWTDCPAMIANTPIHDEGTGYPTQKPLKLLDRIIRASSRPGSLVLDPFTGSGTTLHAAALAGRDALGSDVGRLAIATTARRLERANIAYSRLSARKESRCDNELRPLRDSRRREAGRRES